MRLIERQLQEKNQDKLSNFTHFKNSKPVNCKEISLPPTYKIHNKQKYAPANMLLER